MQERTTIEPNHTAEVNVSIEELQESLLTGDSLDSLQCEVKEIQQKRRKQEIESVENPILKGRFIAELKQIQGKEANKEAELQELLRLWGNTEEGEEWREEEC